MFDTHVHFDVIEGPDTADVLERASRAGVDLFVAVGGSRVANDFAVKTASRFPGRVFAAVGYDRDQATVETGFESLEPLVLSACPVAIGEIGLDYHYLPDTAEDQKRLFKAQLDVAALKKLPVIVHSREAGKDTLDLLSEHRARWTGEPGRIGVIHCFTGDKVSAGKLLDLGFHISFSGIITFRSAVSIREAAAFVPEDRLLVETDSPLLAPVPHRGKANEPAFLPLVVKSVAESRKADTEVIAQVTTVNACRLFGIRKHESS